MTKNNQELDLLNQMSDQKGLMKSPHVTTLKNKMFGYTLVIIVLMSVLSVYSLTITNVYKERIDAMFERNIKLNEIKDILEKVDNELVVYLSTKSSTSLNNYMLQADMLNQKVVEAVSDVKSYSEEELMVLDINNMVFNYIQEAEIAVQEKRRSDVVAYTERYNNTARIKAYIEFFINELNIRQLDTNATSYVYMAKQVRQSNFLNIFLILNLLLLSFLIVLRMSDKMINPIIRLSHFAEDLSKGRFDTREIEVKTNDEIEILANAFNRMKHSIRLYIEELKEKALTEARLKDQQMENLEMQSLLNNAKLYALQSQMNPHFLFNTINAGVQLSMIEGANRTSEFLESMSRLFRYNIKHLDSPVTIGDEVANVQDYYELLKVRFGDLIAFEFKVDPSALKYLMPPLVLQPIVENAYIHGLSKKESEGIIKVQVLNKEDSAFIIVEDSGNGISDVDANKIMSTKKENSDVLREENSKPTGNGIGMQNVIARLELFYKREHLFVIEGYKGIGTKVTVEIPHKKESL